MASGHRSPPSLIQTHMGDRRASEMLNTWQFSFNALNLRSQLIEILADGRAFEPVGPA
jgi:hypothetical protein